MCGGVALGALKHTVSESVDLKNNMKKKTK
jgi:hypothetical protein